MNDICARRDEMVNEGKLKKTEIQPQILYFYLHESNKHKSGFWTD